MKALITILARLAIVNLASAVLTEDFDDHYRCNQTSIEEHECQGETVFHSPEFEKAQDACLEEKLAAIEAGNKDREKGLTCIAVCEWKKLGLLGPSGFNTQKVDEYLKSMKLSEALTKKIKAGSEECFKLHSAKLKFDSTDKKCSSFKEFAKCQVESFQKVCDDKFDPEDWEF